MRTSRALVGLACVGLLVGCAGSGGVASPTASPTTGATSPSTASPEPAGSPGSTLAPVGSLVTASVPAAQRAVDAEVYFGGLTVSRASGGARKVVYPAAQVQYDEDLQRVVVHLKLPLFTCPVHGDLRRIERTACTDRTVTYADADERSATVTPGRGGSFVVHVVAPTYRYGAGVDRSAKDEPAATGETIDLRLRIRPGPVLSRGKDAVTFRAKGVAQRPGIPGVAVQDDRYTNRLVRRGG